MAIYKYLRKFWQSNEKDAVMKQRTNAWRKEPATVRLERPMRLDRARSVGYKAKQGFIVVRQRVIRGGHRRQQLKAGRRSRNTSSRKNLSLNYQRIAEGRVAEKYPNMTVLNSYEVGKDGKSFWFEVILIDGSHPNIKNSNLKAEKGRVQRGKTQAGRKGRGMRRRVGSKGVEKNYPSLKNKHNKGRGN